MYHCPARPLNLQRACKPAPRHRRRPPELEQQALARSRCAAAGDPRRRQRDGKGEGLVAEDAGVGLIHGFLMAAILLLHVSWHRARCSLACVGGGS